MKITIDKSLDLPLSPALAWDMLNDIEGVAACLPGAKITERVDETHYKGTVSVKLGPATVSFKGNIEIASADPVSRQLHIIGTGSDAGGTSGASLDLHAKVEPTEDGGSRLSGASEVAVNGKVAAFGARLMNSVSEVLLQKFFANLGARAEVLRASQPAAAAPVSAATAMMEEATVSGPPAPVAVAATMPAPAAETKLNAFALIWAVLRDFIGNLFHRTKGHMTAPAQPQGESRMAAIAAMQRSLEAAGYICERDLAATLLLMGDLGRPLLVEGDPGVGKTEIAKALARTRGTTLIRLQCFEGLDLHHALYEWNYQRQLLAIRVAEAAGAGGSR